MTLKEFQNAAMSSAVYPGVGLQDDKAITYTVVGLAGEAGEVANTWKKHIRGDDDSRSAIIAQEKCQDRKQELCGELFGVLWYAAALASELGTNLDKIAQDGLEELRHRVARGMIKGDGNKR